jgi:hypothetical protein
MLSEYGKREASLRRVCAAERASRGRGNLAKDYAHMIADPSTGVTGAVTVIAEHGSGSAGVRSEA